jgi:hypothetical protein
MIASNRGTGPLLIVLACLASPAVFGGELSAVINGKSYHSGAIEDWNEKNYGFGLEYELASRSRWKARLMANSFVDSTENLSHMAGAGVYRRLYQSGDFLSGLYVDLGINAFLMTREDVNDSRPFPGVLPSLSIGNRHAGINLTWLPRAGVEAMYDSEAVDPGITDVFFLQFKISTAIFATGD